MEERRLHPRLDIRLTVQYRVEGDSELRTGVTSDLSAGGAALLTQEHIRSGTLLSRVRFSLPNPESGDEQSLEVAAVVVHSRPYSAPDEPFRFLAGLQFLDLHGADFEQVRVFVVRRLQRG